MINETKVLEFVDDQSHGGHYSTFPTFTPELFDSDFDSLLELLGPQNAVLLGGFVVDIEFELLQMQHLSVDNLGQLFEAGPAVELMPS